MKTRYFFLAILTMIVMRDAWAAYDRHDGSIYSCNEINAERAYAERHNQPEEAVRLHNEYEKYCENHN